MKIIQLPWDSEFFSARIGKVMINSAEDIKILKDEQQFLRSNFDVLYVFCDKEYTFNFREISLVDKKVVYKKKTSIHKITNAIEVFFPDKPNEELYNLALASGKYSRFNTDERFPEGSFNRLYCRWIEDSVNHEIADEVFCYMNNGRIVGMATAKYESEEATIGLVAVDERFLRRGICRSLIQAIDNKAYEKAIPYLSVATQRANMPACCAYERAGFMKESITPIYHWWLSK